MPVATDQAKEAARRVVDGERERLVRLSDALHAEPEIAFCETESAERTAAVLADRGFRVDAGVAGLPTAFSARYGSGPLTVALCAEYDALPGIGHACGHNLIAASSVGAGLALAEVADEVGLTVLVLGTPAEEGGGGKVTMLDAGAFEGVHAAMMVHPWPTERLVPHCLAVDHIEVHYAGRDAHASAAPWEGVNAADAMTVAQVALGLLRQQLHPGDQVHGIVTDGGSAVNVIPSSVSGRFMARAEDLDALSVLQPRVRHCFEAGALATGATLEVTSVMPIYSHMVSDPGLLAAYRANAESLGRRFSLDDEGAPPPTLSTDMANVSLAVPTIHPMIAIEAGGAVNHQPEFTAACVGPSAEQALYDGALALAWTAIDAALQPELRQHLLEGLRSSSEGRRT